MRYVLGIDQGGTKTHALVGDELGHILGAGCDEGSCHSVNGMDHAMWAAGSAARMALERAHIAADDLAAVAAGMTGVDWPEEAGLLNGALSRTLGVDRAKIHVVNDCIIALRAATDNPRGCVLCAGTGLNCAVRDGAGGEYVFGYYIPDADQGGLALAERVLRAVFDAQSGMGPATSLTGRCLAVAGCDTVDALLRKKVECRLTKAERNQLPIIVEEEALKGDAVSAQILTRFGRDTAAYAAAALRRMGLELQPVDVVLSGSIFKCKAPMLIRAVRETVLATAPRARIIESALEPAVGALLLALDDLGASGERIQRHLERDAQRFNMVRDTTRAKERIS